MQGAGCTSSKSRKLPSRWEWFQPPVRNVISLLLPKPLLSMYAEKRHAIGFSCSSTQPILLIRPRDTAAKGVGREKLHQMGTRGDRQIRKSQVGLDSGTDKLPDPIHFCTGHDTVLSLSSSLCNVSSKRAKTRGIPYCSRTRELPRTHHSPITKLLHMPTEHMLLLPHLVQRLIPSCHLIWLPYESHCSFNGESVNNRPSTPG